MSHSRSSSSRFPSEARIKGKDVSLKNEDGSLTYLGMVNTLPIPQCVWLVECISCFYQGYEDHKAEATQLLLDHHYAQHTETEEES